MKEGQVRGDDEKGAARNSLRLLQVSTDLQPPPLFAACPSLPSPPHHPTMHRSRSRSSSPTPLLPHSGSVKSTPIRGGRRGYLTFFGTAALTGIIFHILFIGFGGNEVVREVPVLKDWMPAKTPEVKVIYEECPDTAGGGLDPYHTKTAAAHSTKPTADVSIAVPSTSGGNLDQGLGSIEDLRAMVSKTKGYYGRDYSLGLGWNNVGLSSS